MGLVSSDDQRSVFHAANATASSARSFRDAIVEAAREHKDEVAAVRLAYFLGLFDTLDSVGRVAMSALM